MYVSLKFKIIIAAFFITSAILTFSAWRDIKFSEQAILEGQIEKTVLYSDRIEHGIILLMIKNNWKELQKFIQTITTDSKELKEVRIFRPEDGIIVASSEASEIGEKIYEEDFKRIEMSNFQEAFLVQKGNKRYSSKLTEIRNLPECYRCHGSENKVLGILDIELSLTKIHQTIRKVKKEHLTDAFVGFFLIGGGFLLVIGILIDRPIKKMIKTIRKIEDGDSSIRMDEDKKDEFGLMAKSFNSMLESLVSARNQLEDYHVTQMQKASKLASLGEIISGIAHEIKNPLAGISCAVQVFHSELEKGDSRREVTSEILDHIRRLDGIVKGLLNYAKPKPPQFLPCNVSDVLDKAIFFVYPEAKKQQVHIEPDLDPDMSSVMMDPDQMQQVFLNLMINAVQAMPDGGKLKITIHKTEKDNRVVSNEIKKIISSKLVVIIKFTDTGKGVDKESLQNIFDPFFTKKSKGTGLGLSISQRIVQEHGGEISVESEICKGSVFSIYLPVIDEQ
jgi:signal transduction histidine kinase